MNLKTARLLMNMSQSQLSTVIGVSQPLIHAWESGKEVIPGRRKQQLEQIFKVPITAEKEIEMNEHFQNGRIKALAEIEAKIEAKLNKEGRSGEQLTNSRFTGSAPARSSRERLGLTDYGNQDHERANERGLSKTPSRRAEPRTSAPPLGSATRRGSLRHSTPSPALSQGLRRWHR